MKNIMILLSAIALAIVTNACTNSGSGKVKRLVTAELEQKIRRHLEAERMRMELEALTAPPDSSPSSSEVPEPDAEK